ncbi:MAG TPA: S-methyl-5'-thioadenosine phosphorylase [Bacteroidales bacterium]|nr:S-methyl-5'-thioadenosine phosphorylase [Bacteroidales bacterium]
MEKYGIIGGSGLENPNILQHITEIEIETPYGKPSSSLKCGNINGTEVVLLSRHGRDHSIPPSQVNNRANIWALKEAGCTHILATTAVGSLQEHIYPGKLVVLDQFIDFTKHRKTTFFEKFEQGEMKHTPMATPFSDQLRNILIATAQKLDMDIEQQGTVITIEGPRFSTRAESKMFRLWGADVINMSTAPECILANELNIPYAAIAMSTDYDCWKTDIEPVSWEAVITVFIKNVDKVIRLITESLKK